MADDSPYEYNSDPSPEDNFELDIPIIKKKSDSSLDNNCDVLSNKNDDPLGDLLGENFEKDGNKKLSEINLLDDNPLEKPEDQLMAEAEEILKERGVRSEEVLEGIINRFDSLSTEKMVRLVSLVMAVKGNSQKEYEFFARAIIFLKELWTRLSKIDNVGRYALLLDEILKCSHPLYSINLSEEELQIVALYFSDSNEAAMMMEDEDNLFANLNPHPYKFNSQLVGTLESMLSEHFNSMMDIPSPVNHMPSSIYCFVHRNFIQAAFRKATSQLLTNVILLARAPDLETRHNYMDTNQEGIFIADFSLLDKREIEDYVVCIAEIAIGTQAYAEKYLFRLVDWLLGENSQIQRRISGFKVLSELVAAGRAKPDFSGWLAEWLTGQQILQKFLRESTNARILQQIPPVLHFLYEHGDLQNSYLVELMKMSLHSEDLFRIVQGMLSWLRVQHLEEAYDMLTLLKDRDKQPLLSQFLNSLVSSPTLMGNNRKRKNIMIQDNRRELQGEMDIQVDELSEKAEFLVKRLMRLLVQKATIDQQLFMPILLRHITAHMKLLKPQLEKEIVTLLRGNSPVGAWILEQCLKVQTSHDQGQGKLELIGRLASQGAYQFTLALIARHRYSRNVVEKCLNVIVLFCRFHKPLERSATEFLWKVLGLTATDERQREQFFVFLKDIVRFEGAVSEESVNFIYFQLLMGLCADWFSLRVYDCLEMLFLRLNQDCKLISFEKDHYNVIQPPLIGADKLWYIYFNCTDLKVIKKCKEFICKLIMNSNDKKEQLYQDSLTNIKKYLEASLQLSGQLQNKKQVLILRGFQISEKLQFERERVEEGTKYNTINLKIIDSTPDSFEKVKSFDINEKLSLSDLKAFLGENLNPPRNVSEIELLNKGKLLVGQKQTLKEMKLDNNETITVTLINKDIEPLSISQKDQIKKEQQQQLTDLFGDSFSSELIQFVVQKFQGQSLENIANVMCDQARIDQINEEFLRSKEEAEEEIKIEKIQKNEPKKFGEMLVQTMGNVQLLLKCLMVSHNKKGGWKFLKELPINKDYFKIVEEHIQTGDWIALFKGRTQQESKYIAYILTQIIRQSSTQQDTIFNEKQLRSFLIQWILEVVEESMENLEDYENIFKLLLISLTCPLFAQVDAFMADKKGDEEGRLAKKLQNMMDIEPLNPVRISAQICCKLMQALTISNLSEKMTLAIVKLYLYQLFYYPEQESSYSILYHKQLYMLLLRYGKPIVFTAVTTAIRLRDSSRIVEAFNISKFTLNLLHEFIKCEDIKQSHFHYDAFFSCIEELLFMTPVQNPTQELNTLSTILAHIKDRISNLLEPQIIGYMKISLKLLSRHLKTEHGERRNDELRQFAQWLFNHYLFGIHASLPFFKSKSVRKISYQLIIGLCAYHQINKNIVSSVKKLMNNCKDLQKEQGEFRNADFIGMKNLGATCYINSLIQQLYHTVFPKMLLQDDGEGSQGQIKLLELKKLFTNLYIGVKSPVSTNRYVETVKINGQHIRPLVQQDVNEYFASLMHQIQQSVGNKAINSTMSGTLCHQIRGLEEGAQVKNVEQTYLTLMIEMKGKKNLNEALAALSKQHILEGDNMYYSEFLHKKIRASSKTYLDKLPPLLVITLKRFYWNFESMTRHKINDLFEFPMELELSKYAVPGKKESDHYYDYKLCGILIHSGSAQSGHYYSFIKVGQKWLEFNDRRVSEWDIQTNLKNECFGGNQERSRNAYMLFYERVDSQVHGACLHELPNENKLIKLVKNENQSFIKNRLIYDSGYIDFIKDLAKMEGNSSLLDILDGLNINRCTYESSSTLMDIDPFSALSAGDVQKNKDKVDLTKKVDDIYNGWKNKADLVEKDTNVHDEWNFLFQDTTPKLLMPHEKGTENDKL